MRSSSAITRVAGSCTWRAPATGSRHLRENGCSSIFRDWRSASVRLGNSPNRGADAGGQDLTAEKMGNVCGYFLGILAIEDTAEGGAVLGGELAVELAERGGIG